MTAAETISEFLDQIRNCIAEIRACDPSQVLTDEQKAIWAKAGIEFAFPHLYAALQVAQKMSLEDLFEFMDAFTGKNQLVDEKKNIETKKFESRKNDHFEENTLMERVISQRKRLDK